MQGAFAASHVARLPCPPSLLLTWPALTAYRLANGRDKAATATSRRCCRTMLSAHEPGASGLHRGGKSGAAHGVSAPALSGYYHQPMEARLVKGACGRPAGRFPRLVAAARAGHGRARAKTSLGLVDLRHWGHGCAVTGRGQATFSGQFLHHTQNLETATHGDTIRPPILDRGQSKSTAVTKRAARRSGPFSPAVSGISYRTAHGPR